MSSNESFFNLRIFILHNLCEFSAIISTSVTGLQPILSKVVSLDSSCASSSYQCILFVVRGFLRLHGKAFKMTHLHSNLSCTPIPSWAQENLTALMSWTLTAYDTLKVESQSLALGWKGIKVTGDCKTTVSKAMYLSDKISIWDKFQSQNLGVWTR